ncbi:MAG: AraC family transcriptional regulator [Candidatus Thiodiazotropha taylori]
MTISIDLYADTTDVDRDTDVLEDTLKSLRISGSIVLRETYASPWAVSVPDSGRLAALLQTDKSVQVIAFHLVEFGHCIIKSSKADPVHLKAGEMLVCFGGDAHQLSLGEAINAQTIEALLTGHPNAQQPKAKPSDEQTALLCGVFQLAHTEFNPLYSALPSLMHVNLTRAGAFNNLSGVSGLMAEEIDRRAPGSGYVIARLLEVLCAEAIRSHAENLTQHEASWFRGIKDPKVGKALAIIHNRPGDDWSVHRLADEVSMSPSRFAVRFAETIGDTPMAYLTRWRMNLACRDLADNKYSVSQIAECVGYDSPAAFSRAFKKHIGETPVAWRARMMS